MYRREKIILNFKSGLESDIFIKYTIPGSGKTLVFLSQDPIFYFNLSGIGFNKINFWVERFNELIRRYCAVELDYRAIDEYLTQNIMQVCRVWIDWSVGASNVASNED